MYHITVKGNASGSRAPARWLVIEAVNAEEAWNAIVEASATGSIGAHHLIGEPFKDERTLARVHRYCDKCGQLAGVYGACHDPDERRRQGLPELGPREAYMLHVDDIARVLYRIKPANVENTADSVWHKAVREFMVELKGPYFASYAFLRRAYNGRE